MRDAHGVAWSGRSSTRNGLVAERVDQRPDDVGVPALERRDLLVDRTLVAGFVGGLDVQEEEVAIGERRERGVALRDVVVVEPGGGAGHVEHLDAREHAETAHEIDRRRQPAVDTVTGGEVGQLRTRALAPEPDLRGDRVDLGRGARDDRLRRVHQAR